MLKPLRGALTEWAPGRALGADPLHTIGAAWPAIVGPGVAANSAPLSVTAGTLTIATRSSAWSQQLQFLSREILAGIHALPQGAGIERLAFRAGALRRRGLGNAAATRPAGGGAGTRMTPGPAGPLPAPAADLEEAFARVRRRLTALRRAAPATCRTCDAPLPPGAPAEISCAPCAGAAEQRRTADVERMLYMAPWLTSADLREHVPEATPGEIERARRHLLQRWWVVLERARRSGRTGASGLERQVASSYVLLQSRLPPDRITPAIVRNLVGPELHALLWPGQGV